jgi:hypothetical protein
MTQLVQWLRPLELQARNAFLEELAAALRQEPEQPPGDGAVFRVARGLLRSGQLHRDPTMVIADGTYHSEPRHYAPGGYKSRQKRA